MNHPRVVTHDNRPTIGRASRLAVRGVVSSLLVVSSGAACSRTNPAFDGDGKRTSSGPTPGGVDVTTAGDDVTTTGVDVTTRGRIDVGDTQESGEVTTTTTSSTNGSAGVCGEYVVDAVVFGPAAVPCGDSINIAGPANASRDVLTVQACLTGGCACIGAQPFSFTGNQPIPPIPECAGVTATYDDECDLVDFAVFDNEDGGGGPPEIAWLGSNRQFPPDLPGLAVQLDPDELCDTAVPGCEPGLYRLHFDQGSPIRWGETERLMLEGPLGVPLGLFDVTNHASFVDNDCVTHVSWSAVRVPR